MAHAIALEIPASSPKWFSPRNPLGALGTALVIHGLAYGFIVLLIGFDFLHAPEAPQGEVEVGYEVLNEPPPPNPVVQKVVRAREPDAPVDTHAKPDNSPKELQDKNGEVAGTQTAQKSQSNVGAETDGVANSTPFYKIKPKYPKAALVDGVEGWVMLKVDITEKGEVENVRVIDGEKRNLFQDEARRAIEKWKYHPFLNSQGVAIRKADHQVRIDFKLNDV